MIYLTQLIFVKKGKEEIFHEFENFAIPLMEKYKGRIIHRLRPQKENYISSSAEQPYEIHFISFDSEDDLQSFLQDDTRQNFMHLKNESVQSSILIKGKEM